MTFKQVRNQIDLKQKIKDYFIFSQVIDDVGINEKLIDVLDYQIENYVFNLFDDFECLYDMNYSLNYLNICIINQLPELAQCLIKNNLAISKIFRSYENMKVTSKTIGVYRNQYEGLNVTDDYKSSNNEIINQATDAVATMMSLDVKFKNCLEILKNDIEKMLRLIY